MSVWGARGKGSVALVSAAVPCLRRDKNGGGSITDPESVPRQGEKSRKSNDYREHEGCISSRPLRSSLRRKENPF